MKKFYVGIDIDDTVCALSREIDIAVCNKYPVKVNKNEYFLGARYSKGKTKLHAGLVRKILYNDVDWLNLQPAPGVVKYIKKLQKRGAKIVFLTHRSEYYTPDCEITTAKWLNKYFSHYEVIYVRDKIAMCEKMGIKYLIDNSHKVLATHPTDAVNLMFYTGLQPTTVEKTEFEKYSSWEEIFNKIAKDN